MNCAVCGKDNQPGTRFCVHCGASLAAAQAPASRPIPAPSPNATSTVSTRPAPAAAPPLGVNDTGGRTAANPMAPPAGMPAYESEPKGGGAKILIGIGVAALVIAGGFVGYKIFGGSADVKDSFARFDTTTTPRSESPGAPSAPVAAPKEPVDEKTQPPSTPAAPEPAKPEEKAPVKADAAKAEAPKGDGAKAAPDTDKAKVVTPGAKGEAKGPKGAAGTSATSPATPVTPAPAPAARPAPAAAPEPAPAAPVQDRWAQMGEELQRCQKESLFSRIVCDQKVRLRFCDGYWGKVSQCPGNVVNPDRGQ